MREFFWNGSLLQREQHESNNEDSSSSSSYSQEGRTTTNNNNSNNYNNNDEPLWHCDKVVLETEDYLHTILEFLPIREILLLAKCNRQIRSLIMGNEACWEGLCAAHFGIRSRGEMRRDGTFQDLYIASFCEHFVLKAENMGGAWSGGYWKVIESTFNHQPLRAYSLERGLWWFSAGGPIPNVPKGEYFCYWKMHATYANLDYEVFIGDDLVAKTRMRNGGAALRCIQDKDMFVGLAGPIRVSKAHDDDDDAVVYLKISDTQSTYKRNGFRIYGGVCVPSGLHDLWKKRFFEAETNTEGFILLKPSSPSHHPQQ